jgi:transposase
VGRPLAQRLLAQGETVLDVPAKLAARVRVFDTGNARKTDATDAHAVAMVALRTPRLRELAFDEELVALRLLTDRRDELSHLRVQTVNRLHRLLAELIPGGAKRGLSALQAKRLLATTKPRSLVGKTMRRMAAEEIADLVAVDAKLKAIKKELRGAVTERGSHLMDLFGVGPAGAARILADVADVARFPDRNHFASWTGTAPLDASSGDQIRHRLSRAGNRRLNHVIHIAAIVQIRHDTEGRAYYRRKLAESKTPMEALRCLKRRISDAIYRQLVADAKAAAETASTHEDAGPGGALGGVFAIQRGRPVHPGHRLFGPATSRTRSTDATADPNAREPPRGLGSKPPASTRRSRQGGAPHRTNDPDGDQRRRTLQGADTAPLTQRGTRSGRLNRAAPETASGSDSAPMSKRLSGLRPHAEFIAARVQEVEAATPRERIGPLNNVPSGRGDRGCRGVEVFREQQDQRSIPARLTTGAQTAHLALATRRNDADVVRSVLVERPAEGGRVEGLRRREILDAELDVVDRVVGAHAWSSSHVVTASMPQGTDTCRWSSAPSSARPLSGIGRHLLGKSTRRRRR